MQKPSRVTHVTPTYGILIPCVNHIPQVDHTNFFIYRRPRLFHHANFSTLLKSHRTSHKYHRPHQGHTFSTQHVDDSYPSRAFTDVELHIQPTNTVGNKTGPFETQHSHLHNSTWPATISRRLKRAESATDARPLDMSAVLHHQWVRPCTLNTSSLRSRHQQ